MPDDAPWEAYASTILFIGRERELRIDLRRPVSDEHRLLLTKLGLGAAFAVVTPFDPRGSRSSPWKNWWRLRSTRIRLVCRKVRHVPTDGESPDGSHRECGFAVVLPREEAAALARELEQLALYWFDGASFWLDPALSSRPREQLPRPARAAD